MAGVALAALLWWPGEKPRVSAPTAQSGPPALTATSTIARPGCHYPADSSDLPPRHKFLSGLAHPTHATLILAAGCGYATIVEVDDGTVRSQLLPQYAAGDYPFGVVLLGDQLVMDGGSDAYVSPADLPQVPMPIGHDLYFVPSGRDDRVWLVESSLPSGYAVREVDLTGRVLIPVRHLPPGAYPLRGVDGQLIVEIGDGDHIWNRATGALGRAFGPAAIVDVWSTQVAWRQIAACSVPPCPLHLLDVRTGRDRVVMPPPGNTEFTFTGAFSQDGRTLASFCVAPAAHRTSLALVDIATGNVSVESGYQGTQMYPALAWSPSGQWLFFATDGQPNLGACNAADGTTHFLPVGIAFLGHLLARHN